MLQHQHSESTVEACCSFCGKQQHQVKSLTTGPGSVCICNECVDLCRKIIEERGSIDLFGEASPFFVACPSCSTSCRRTDSYCFHCGQKLEQIASPTE